MGEWLAKNVKRGGDRKSTFRKGKVDFLPDGVTYKQSHRLQQLACIPKQVVDEHIADLSGS